MDISSLSNYTDYYSQLADNQTANSTISKLNSANSTDTTDDELMEACKEFESYLLEQVYKNMEKTTKIFSDDDSDSNNQLVDYFKDMAIEEISSEATDQNSIGLAQMLYEQMKVNLNAVTAADLEENAANNGTTAQTQSEE